MEAWLADILVGIGKFFLHPLLYLGLFYAIWLGYVRVKRERKNFHIRVQDGWFEFRTYLTKGLLPGFLLSVIIFLIGFPVPFSFVIISGAVLFLLGLLLKPGVLSPAYTAGSAFFILMAIHYFQPELPILSDYFSENGWIFPGVALLTGLLVMVEGLLIRKNASRNTSPKMIQSKRGLKVGIHETRRLWLVPLLFLIPEGTLSIPFDIWPVVPVDGEGFSILLVPYWIGFSHQVRISLPFAGVRATGKRVLLLGFAVTVIAVAGFWYPLASVVAVGLAIIGRLTLPVLQRIQNNQHPFYFSKNQQGIVVLDIIPGSPAEKMGIQIGEVIKTVNGTAVHNEMDYYAALQRNRAFCKLEVIDANGENRLVNRALYEGEHHELGVIFVDVEKQWKPAQAVQGAGQGTGQGTVQGDRNLDPPTTV